MERTVIALKKKNEEKDAEIKTLQENLKGKDAQVRKLSTQTKYKDELIYSLNDRLDKIHTRHLQEQVGKRKQMVEALKIANANVARLECKVHDQKAYASMLEREVERLRQVVEDQKSEMHHLIGSVAEHTISKGTAPTKEESSDPREQPDNPPADREDGGLMQAAVGVALTAAGVGIGIASMLSRR